MTVYQRARSAHGVVYFVVEQPSQHFRLIDGRWYRDCVVRFPDGRRELRGVREDVA